MKNEKLLQAEEMSPLEQVDAQIRDLRAQLEQAEQDPNYHMSVNKVDEMGQKDTFNSKKTQEELVLDIEEQIKGLEKQKEFLAIDEKIKDLRALLVQVEQDPDYHMSVNKVDEMGQKDTFNSKKTQEELVLDIEEQIRDLENKKNPEKQNTEEDLEKEFEAKVQNAKSIDELISILKALDEILQSMGDFSGKELVYLIEQVRDGGLSIDYIPSKCGIRKKLFELLEEEKQKQAPEEKIEEPEEKKYPIILEEGEPGVVPEALDPVIKPDPKKETPPPLPEAYCIELIENAERDLDDARMRYMIQHEEYLAGRKKKGLIATLKQKLMGVAPQEESQLPDALIEAQEEYTQAKINLGRAMMIAKEAELQRQQSEDVANELFEYKVKDVYKRTIVDEHDILEKFKIESWPPKEKNIFMKSLNWYAAQPRMTKLAFAAMVAAGGAVVGGVAAPTALAFAGGMGIARTLAAMGIGMVAGKGYDMVKKDKSDSRFAQTLEELQENFADGYDPMELATKQYADAKELRDKQKAQHNAWKHVVIFAAAGLAGYGFGKFGAVAAVGGGEVPPSNTPDIPPVTPEVPVTSGTEGVVVETGPQINDNPNIYEEVPVEALITPQIESTVTVGGANDNMWNIIKNQLSERSPEFNQLSKPAQINAIDTLWQKTLAYTPGQLQEMGITSGDPHIIQTGQELNLTSLFETANTEAAITSGQNLTPEQVASITKHTNILERSLAGYSGSIREELVNKIIKSMYTK